jgi:hypothetical protein
MGAYIVLSIVSPEYPYTIYIPFGIIDEITLSEKPEEDWSLNVFYLASIKLGDEPTDLLDFESKESMIEIPWSTIREIVPGAKSDGYKEELKIVAMDESCIKGYCPPYIICTLPVRFGDWLQVTENYLLQVDVELCHFAKVPFTKLQLNLGVE